MNPEKIEELIVKVTLDIIIDSGYFCFVEAEGHVSKTTQNTKELQKELLSVDEAVLTLTKGEQQGKIYFDFEKQGHDCITNYGATFWLEELLSPIFHLCHHLS